MNPSAYLPNVIRNNIAYVNPFRKKIGYIGWVGHGNIGDEAMFQAIQRLFSPSSLLSYSHIKKIIQWDVKNKAGLFKGVCLGGGTIINTGYIKEVRDALNSNYKVFAFGSGVSDSSLSEQNTYDSKNFDEWIKLLHSCLFVGVRGPDSQAILAKKGVKATIIGDPALSFCRDVVVPKSGNKIAGINVGYATGAMAFSANKIRETILDVCRRMKDDGWRFIFYPMWEKDLKEIKPIADDLGDAGTIFKSTNSIEGLLTSMESCDVVIGQKLHSVILAAAANTPGIMIEYRPKCLDFMRSIGCEDFSINEKNLNAQTLWEKLNILTDNLEVRQGNIHDQVVKYRDIQKATAESIMNDLL